MLVDPRPFTYEYRKPRFLNPTFQSRNLYESLYHRYPQQPNDFFPQRVSMRYESDPRMHRPNIEQNKEPTRNLSEPKDRKATYELLKPPQTDRNPQKDEGYRLPAINKALERRQPQLGNNMQDGFQGEHLAQRRKGFERFRIYERQQKPFDIINCFPRENDNNKLRNYPKLTLEDKLLQRGSYHNFQAEPF